MDTGKLEKTLKGHTHTINGIAFDTKGEKLASCSTDMSVKIWDMNKYYCIKTLNGHDHTVSSVIFIHN